MDSITVPVICQRLLVKTIQLNAADTRSLSVGCRSEGWEKPAPLEVAYLEMINQRVSVLQKMGKVSSEMFLVNKHAASWGNQTRND
jgi:hypothetical protein